MRLPGGWVDERPCCPWPCDLADGRLTASAATTLLHLLRLLRLLWLTLWNSRRHRNDLKIAVGDRVFVFLAQEPLLHEEVNRRREVPRSDLALIEIDSPCVLLASEDELGFLLALDLVTPHRHRHGHQDHHHPDADEQRRHGVSALVALTL